VAHTLACYPVSFAGTNRDFTARTIRRVLREAPRIDRPIGIFPEGVAGSANEISDPLPGVDRLLAHLAKAGMPVQPAAISESDRLAVCFGPTIAPGELLAAAEPAKLTMSRIGDLLAAKRLFSH
jgi:1-acyl-sn-glycerol-3-phosphate acyltransferase